MICSLFSIEWAENNKKLALRAEYLFFHPIGVLPLNKFREMGFLIYRISASLFKPQKSQNYDITII